MTEPDVAALAARAISIAEETTKTQTEIVRQQAKSKRTIRLLAVSVLFDVTLSLFCVFLAVSQHNTTNAIHQSQLTACGIGNQARLGQITLWSHVIDVSAAPAHETPAARAARLARLAAFKAYIGRQFRPVNCARLDQK